MIKNNTIIRHPGEHPCEYPLDFIDDTTRIDISFMKLVDCWDRRLTDIGICPTGPDGGVCVHYQCECCDKIYYMNDK